MNQYWKEKRRRKKRALSRQYPSSLDWYYANLYIRFDTPYVCSSQTQILLTVDHSMVEETDTRRLQLQTSTRLLKRLRRQKSVTRCQKADAERYANATIIYPSTSWQGLILLKFSSFATGLLPRSRCECFRVYGNIMNESLAAQIPLFFPPSLLLSFSPSSVPESNLISVAGENEIFIPCFVTADSSSFLITSIICIL